MLNANHPDSWYVFSPKLHVQVARFAIPSTEVALILLPFVSVRTGGAKLQPSQQNRTSFYPLGRRHPNKSFEANRMSCFVAHDSVTRLGDEEDVRHFIWRGAL